VHRFWLIFRNLDRIKALGDVDRLIEAFRELERGADL